jgi:hypothetical protein
MIWPSIDNRNLGCTTAHVVSYIPIKLSTIVTVDSPRTAAPRDKGFKTWRNLNTRFVLKWKQPDHSGEVILDL